MHVYTMELGLLLDHINDISSLVGKAKKLIDLEILRLNNISNSQVRQLYPFFAFKVLLVVKKIVLTFLLRNYLYNFSDNSSISHHFCVQGNMSVVESYVKTRQQVEERVARRKAEFTALCLLCEESLHLLWVHLDLYLRRNLPRLGHPLNGNPFFPLS
jgi:hypothetical protein